MKRFLSSSLLLSQIVAFLAPALVPIEALAFSDVTGSNPHATAIAQLEEDGVLQGYEDGTFRSDNTINRAEFLKIILSARGNVQTSAKNCFPDVGDEWYAQYVCTAQSEGIVAGYPDGTFQPGRDINFVEAAKILTLAYKQQTQSYSADWYEPYARALEQSKAIPESIDQLDHPLTRGEMAEMMWRLSHSITNQPSKGFLNVKFPEMTVDLSSDTPQVATRCADLAAFAQQSGQSGNYGGGVMMRGEMAVPQTAPAPSGNAGKSANTAAQDYSQTNVQVQGVDEGDIVKTDGSRVFIVTQGMIRIVQAAEGSELKELSTIDFSDKQFSPRDLYIDGSRLTVIGQSYQMRPLMMEKMAPNAASIRFPYQPPQTVIQIYDVSNPSKPSLARTVSFDGSAVSSRRIGDKLYMVMNQYIPYWGGPILRDNVTEQGLLPTFTDSASGKTAEPVARCGQVTILPHIAYPQYLTVGVIPLTNNDDIKRTVILGNAENVYASQENLYVAATDWNYRWDAKQGDVTSEQTTFYRFALNDNGAVFASQGSVPGHLLNQFSMDENGAMFRVATTTNSWGTGTSDNQVYVLNQDLKTVGHVDHIARGESIYAVRFMGNRAYVVTFLSIDPLFVLDLSDSRNPKILGELKIPGYSAYLHPYDETHLIGFGKEVDASIDADKVHSTGAVYYTAVQGLKLGLFDVSDVAHPKEIAKQVIGDAGSDSPLLSNHKALLFDKARGLLAFPASVMKVSPNPSSTNEWDKTITTQVFQGAYVFNVDTTTGFTLKGRITHYGPDDCKDTGYGQWCYGKDISRILRLGNTLVTVSDAAVQRHGLPSVTKKDGIEFPTPTTPTGPIMY